MALPKPSFTTDALIEESPAVRVVQVRPDLYTGLKGHAYIKARNLSPQVQRVQTSAHGKAGATAEASNGQ